MDEQPLPQRSDRRRRRGPAQEGSPCTAESGAAEESQPSQDAVESAEAPLPQRKQRRRGKNSNDDPNCESTVEDSQQEMTDKEESVPLHLREKLVANNNDVRDDDARNNALFKPSYVTHPRPPPDPKTLNYEYLDHTADVQLHSWGATLEEAFGWATVAMFGYMTDIQYVDVDPAFTQEIEAEGHDLLSLLFNFMDECLLKFCIDEMVICRVQVASIEKVGAGKDEGAEGPSKFKIKASVLGERWDLQKHPQGTEVKAITYSNMQVKPGAERSDIYVIVDI